MHLEITQLLYALSNKELVCAKFFFVCACASYSLKVRKFPFANSLLTFQLKYQHVNSLYFRLCGTFCCLSL